MFHCQRWRLGRNCKPRNRCIQRSNTSRSRMCRRSRWRLRRSCKPLPPCNPKSRRRHRRHCRQRPADSRLRTHRWRQADFHCSHSRLREHRCTRIHRLLRGRCKHRKHRTCRRNRPRRHKCHLHQGRQNKCLRSFLARPQTRRSRRPHKHWGQNCMRIRLCNLETRRFHRR